MYRHSLGYPGLEPWELPFFRELPLNWSIKKYDEYTLYGDKMCICLSVRSEPHGNDSIQQGHIFVLHCVKLASRSFEI